MARIAEPRPAAEPSSAVQQQRRDAILQAAAALAAQKPADQVQMNEVARAAGVALGTLYRYFPSKTHLGSSASWPTACRMQDGIRRRKAPAGTAADRVFDVLSRATRPTAAATPPDRRDAQLTEHRRCDGRGRGGTHRPSGPGHAADHFQVWTIQSHKIFH